MTSYYWGLEQIECLRMYPRSLFFIHNPVNFDFIWSPTFHNMNCPYSNYVYRSDMLNILLVAIWMMKQLLYDKVNNNSEAKLHKYVQMD